MNTAENRNGAATKSTPSVPVVTVEAPETQKRTARPTGSRRSPLLSPRPMPTMRRITITPTASTRTTSTATTCCK